MNFKEGTNASYLHPSKHEDLDKEIDKSIVDTAAIEDLREDLLEVWEIHEQRAKTHGSITGPTHAMAIYLELFHTHSDRFITGTDFVSSFGAPDKYPGTLEKGRGCVKDKKNHARQVMDTGSINMFLNDESFKQIFQNYSLTAQVSTSSSMWRHGEFGFSLSNLGLPPFFASPTRQ